MKPHGYAGKILRVDLTEGEIVAESSKRYVERFVGGRGVNAWFFPRFLWHPVTLPYHHSATSKPVSQLSP